MWNVHLIKKKLQYTSVSTEETKNVTEDNIHDFYGRQGMHTYINSFSLLKEISKMAIQYLT
jgi:hypothetical protein